MPLSPANQKALDNTARRLGIPSRRLYALISFESNFNPKILNPITKAAGLIQFMPKTAASMGYKNQYDLILKHPTIKSQLETPVYNYLKKYKPFTGDQSLFMAVFYPKARTWPSFKRFPDYVRKVNPGINTPGDYTKLVYRKAKLTYLPPLLILVGLGTAIYYTIIKKGGRYAAKKTSTQSKPGGKPEKKAGSRSGD